MATEGSRALAKAVSPPVMTQAQLARRLNCSPQWISDLVHGRATPGADLMATLEDLLGIPMRAWTVRIQDEADQASAGHG